MCVQVCMCVCVQVWGPSVTAWAPCCGPCFLGPLWLKPASTKLASLLAPEDPHLQFSSPHRSCGTTDLH